MPENRRICSVATVAEYFPTSPDTDDPTLDRALNAACVAAERLTRRRFLAKDYDLALDGDGAVGRENDATELWLPWRPIQSVASVTENGTSLALASVPGLSPSGAGVLAYRDDGYLVRGAWTSAGFSPQDWAAGRANVRVVYRAGWEFEEAPDDLTEAIAAWTWHLYQLGKGMRIGNVGSARGGDGTQYLEDLPKMVLAILDDYQDGSRPVAPCANSVLHDPLVTGE